MNHPVFPSNETERLAALRSFCVLDTAPEASFDALTRLAASLLDVPISLISISDVKRQWFKSRHGLDAPELPREGSFCSYVVANGASVVVLDASTDIRFAENPIVAGGPRIRFYAGMPLRTQEGFVLGTLCTIDCAPRAPTANQLEMLALIAAQVVDQLEARRSRLQLEVLFAAMAEGVLVHDNGGKITSANASAGAILGVPVSALLGRRSLALGESVREDGSVLPVEAQPPMRTLSTAIPEVGVVTGVHVPSGELRWLRVSSLPLRNDAGLADGAVTTIDDITAIRSAHQEIVARHEHLVTTGTLAAGLGHEINNPLAYIHANLDLAIEEVQKLAPVIEKEKLEELGRMLGEARDGAERIRKIVRGLHSLARADLPLLPIDVGETIDASIQMATHAIRSKAKLAKQVIDVPPVLADGPRLSQVVVSLLVNAAQAFPVGDVEKNRITVATRVHGFDRIEISVSDNCPGIDPELRRRIFDPFFTTKAVGQGSGLGLAICRSIVADFGGEIRLESTVGAGSTFRVLLSPATAIAAVRDETSPTATPTTTRGRVLVVDDEPGILSSIRRSLQRDFDVVLCEDPREALLRIENGETFDAIFCDLTMPHLTGDALFDCVEKIAPALSSRFIFMTGGAADARIQDFLANVTNRRIEKPFSIHDLRQIVARLMAPDH
ncbi:ATP-binding protein [soil metagenome]